MIHSAKADSNMSLKKIKDIDSTIEGMLIHHYELKVVSAECAVTLSRFPVHSSLQCVDHFMSTVVVFPSKDSFRPETGTEQPPCLLLTAPHPYLSSHIWRSPLEIVMKI